MLKCNDDRHSQEFEAVRSFPQDRLKHLDRGLETRDHSDWVLPYHLYEFICIFCTWDPMKALILHYSTRLRLALGIRSQHTPMKPIMDRILRKVRHCWGYLVDGTELTKAVGCLSRTYLPMRQWRKARRRCLWLPYLRSKRLRLGVRLVEGLYRFVSSW
jgi:hypothetical protein